MLVFPFLAIACCVGLPLLFGGAGLSLIAALKGGPAVGIITLLVISAITAVYAFKKRHESTMKSAPKDSNVTR